jgi:hypothetical protein
LKAIWLAADQLDPQEGSYVKLMMLLAVRRDELALAQTCPQIQNAIKASELGHQPGLPVPRKYEFFQFFPAGLRQLSSDRRPPVEQF